MAAPMEPSVLVRQVRALGADLSAMVADRPPVIEAQLSGLDLDGVSQIVLCGNGDSLHAALAARATYESVAGLPCAALGALPVAAYGVRVAPGATVVVAASASGNTERVVEALTTAHRSGARTVAITSNPRGAVTEVADAVVLTGLADLEPSPGMRTYQASLAVLLLIAIEIAHRRARLSPTDAAALRGEIGALASRIDRLAANLESPCRTLAGEIADADAMVVLGTGPSLGSAHFVAAKLVEAAGCFAVGQDVEEWCHVERFATPADMPVVILAPDGPAAWCAGYAAAKAKPLGRRIVAVAPPGESDLIRSSWRVLPVPGAVREEFAPLLHSVVAGHLGAFLAEAKGRRPFQA